MDNAPTRAQLLEHFLSVFMPEELALPVMSNQKMNDALKILFKHAGLDKPITRTYFVGRKTFVVIGLSPP